MKKNDGLKELNDDDMIRDALGEPPIYSDADLRRLYDEGVNSGRSKYNSMEEIIAAARREFSARPKRA